MADEIKITTNANVTNGTYRLTFTPGTISVTQSTQGSQEGIVIVGSGAVEAVDYGDVAVKGWYMGRNLDPTNFVDWGPFLNSTMVPMGKIESGETFMFRGNSTTIMGWQADTADVKVQLVVLED